MPAVTFSKTNKSGLQWVDEWDSGLEKTDRGLRLFGMDGIFGMVYHGSEIATGKPSEVASQIGGPLTAARSVVSMAKSLTRAIDVFTGTMWARWKKVSWISIAIDISLVVARFFNIPNWLGRTKAVDLGKHAGWISIMVTVGFTATNVLCLMDATDSFIQSSDQTPAVRKEKAAKLAYNVIDTLASPWENGVGFGASPTMNLIGAIFSSIACGMHFICDWFFASPDSAEDLLNERIDINAMIPNAPGFNKLPSNIQAAVTDQIAVDAKIRAAA